MDPSTSARGHDKSALRREASRARAEAHAAAALYEPPATELLLSHLHDLGDPDVVSAYLPIRSEISPLAAMQRLHAAGTRVGVPVIRGRDRPLEFHEWTPGAELVEGPFGVEFPADTEMLVPDVVITPLLAFDARGFRLGYGAGFYDRTFPELHARARGLGVGFAYSAQRIVRVPNDATDVPLHSIVTETGVEIFAAGQ